LKIEDGKPPIALRSVNAAVDTRTRMSAYSTSVCPSSRKRKDVNALTTSWFIVCSLLFETLHLVDYWVATSRETAGRVALPVRSSLTLERLYAVSGGLNRPLVGCEGRSGSLQSESCIG
jgi:hypothetical protein